MQMNCLYREFKFMQNQFSTGFNLMVPILIIEMFKTLTRVLFYIFMRVLFFALEKDLMLSVPTSSLWQQIR